jgi:hypothetical protein
MAKKYENKKPERMTERLDRLGLLINSEKRARGAFYDWLGNNGYAEERAANRPRQAAIDTGWANLISSGTTYAWSADLITELHGSNPFVEDAAGKHFTISQLCSDQNVSDLRERGHWIELLRDNGYLNQEGKPTQEALDAQNAVPRDFFIAEWTDTGLTSAVNKFLETYVAPVQEERHYDGGLDRSYSRGNFSRDFGGGGGDHHKKSGKRDKRDRRRERDEDKWQ